MTRTILTMLLLLVVPFAEGGPCNTDEQLSCDVGEAPSLGLCQTRCFVCCRDLADSEIKKCTDNCPNCLLVCESKPDFLRLLCIANCQDAENHGWSGPLRICTVQMTLREESCNSRCILDCDINPGSLEGEIVVELLAGQTTKANNGTDS